MELLKILENELSASYKVKDIEHPILHNFPVCVRFEIGNGSPYENNKLNDEYITQAVCRAESIFESLRFSNRVLLVFDIFQEANRNTRETLEKILQTITGLFQHELYKKTKSINDEELHFDRNMFLFSLDDFNYQNLFKQIVCSELGGNREFASSIFIFDLEKHTMFYLYDDRGLDVAAENADLLKPIAEKYSKWIMN